MQAEYVDHMGDDLRVVNAARVSFNKESEYDLVCFCGNKERTCEGGSMCCYSEDEVLRDSDSRLISYLSKHGHWTPFSHVMVTLRETVPIFVARQRFKHMVGFTYNEVSRRYVDDDPEFFYPEVWRTKSDNKKQGSGGPVSERSNWFTCHDYAVFIHDAEVLYKKLLDRGVCPEQARMVLPQSMYTSYYVTGSLAAWARAYKQRSDPHSQVEIQDLAKQWTKIIEPLFPVSWKALTQ